MTVLALFAMAAAPSAQQQAVREREKEAIFRGEQVADAIRDYYRYRSTLNRGGGDQALPTSMDQLLEGIPIPGGSKNRQILRPSAARDPLTIEGEWRFVLPRTEGLIDFQQSVMFAVPRITSVTNLGSLPSKESTSSIDDDATGPFVGVASRSHRESVLTYYGIERHDQWIFTPLFR
jgi:type II secretory pathway pseudopilin PulG